MSIILQAVRLREAMRAPRLVSLYGDLARRTPLPLPLQLPLTQPQRRTAVGAAAMCGLLLLLYSVGDWRAAQRRDRPSVPVGAVSSEVADIPMLQSLPARPSTGSAVGSRPGGSAGSMAGGAAGVGGTTPARQATTTTSATATTSAAQAAQVPAAQRSAPVFRPPTSLAAPLPGPSATVATSAWSGGVPPAPGSATAAPPFAMPVFTPAPKVEPVYQTVADLPEEVRRAVQRLRVQVHLYVPLARHRLVMVDGQSVREGEELLSGVRLDEITPRGLVLRHGELRVKLETPFVRP
ncbi:general secretion pathway protein GspB [Roseateles sp. SL47]|uniref:general secretion pathway protein GspB n=1 Tax=Roseateles sp. SL47 TaxID=2995138 RepID=UPI0022702F33|nr:general secretion pathway protein GspB [Roseateles sp. SL47]WAC74568.1 general secretion pathway protein GspB [Roseateles sp. SL47]